MYDISTHCSDSKTHLLVSGNCRVYEFTDTRLVLVLPAYCGECMQASLHGFQGLGSKARTRAVEELSIKGNEELAKENSLLFSDSL